MKLFISILFCYLFICCSSYEQIGKYKYKIKNNRVNIGEFDGLIKYYKQYYIKEDDKKVFSTLIKSQKLDFETPNDSVFAYGKIELKKDNNKVYILIKEININGYENFSNIDSIVRTYEQSEMGKTKLNKIVSYRNGIENIIK